MLSPMLRAVAQLDDPVFLGVLLRSLVLSVLAFVGLIWLSGPLYAATGGGAFWAMAALCAAAVPLAWRLR